MLPYVKNRDNLVIIIHEIYGMNKHMQHLSKWISHLEWDVLCPKLLPSGKVYREDQEHEAYTYFVNHIGFEKGVSIIMTLIETHREKYKKIYLIGFSVGATIAWLCSNKRSVDGIICSYGSRIRDYVDKAPACPALLFFPSVEKSFRVWELVVKLNENKNVKVHVFQAEHGFANPYSKKFCKESHERTLHLMKEALVHTAEGTNLSFNRFLE